MRIDEINAHHIVILDAARHDLYEEVNGKTRKRRTLGSSSEEFIKETFSEGAKWKDTVVVTANPHYHAPLFEKQTGRTPEETFKDIYNGFARDDLWENGTVPPKNMLKLLEEALEDHNPTENAFIVHFMQPHTPLLDSHIENDADRDMNVWDRLEKGEYTDQEVWKAFKDNLETVMLYAEEACFLLDGVVAITADHGNAFGENGEYGPPFGSQNPVLRTVPLDIR